MSVSSAPTLTMDNFYDVVEARPLFVKFYQPWCGHCTSMKPDWDKLADDYGSSQSSVLNGGSSVLIADVNCSEVSRVRDLIFVDFQV